MKRLSAERGIWTLLWIFVIALWAIAALYLYFPKPAVVLVGGLLIYAFAGVAIWRQWWRAGSEEQARRPAQRRHVYGAAAGGIVFLACAFFGITRNILEEGWHWYYLLLLVVPVGVGVLFLRLAWRLHKSASPEP